MQKKTNCRSEYRQVQKVQSIVHVELRVKTQVADCGSVCLTLHQRDVAGSWVFLFATKSVEILCKYERTNCLAMESDLESHFFLF